MPRIQAIADQLERRSRRGCWTWEPDTLAAQTAQTLRARLGGMAVTLRV